MASRFLQIHTLTSYAASLLNRDDAGFAKRIPFGNTVRTRISSQCLKRHWRTQEGEGSLQSLGQPMSLRSRVTFEHHLVRPLLAEKLSEETVRAVVAAISEVVLGQSLKKKAEKDDAASPKPKKGKKGAAETDGATVDAGTASMASPPLEPVSEKKEVAATGQITVLGPKEIDYLLKLARDVCKATPQPKDAEKKVKEVLGAEGKKNLASLGKAAAGLDGALFGRMVTSDMLAHGDAAIQVAHAFTVHAENSEPDYFSAIDELAKAEEHTLGSGHIGSTELTTGLFYGYVVIDVPLLISNLEGCKPEGWQKADRTLASQVVQTLLPLVTKASPGAKKGSTAPYAYSHLAMVEAGNDQPRTLANAFLRPVSPRSEDVLQSSYQAIATYLQEFKGMYGLTGDRALSGMFVPNELLAGAGVAKGMTLQELSTWAASTVKA